VSYAEVDRDRLHEQGGWFVARQIADRGTFAHRAARRHEIYVQLQKALNGMRYAQPLQPERAADFPPYVLPLVLRKDPEAHFQSLRRQGVPMFRWEHSPAGVCAVTDAYRTSLVQLPCHDTLSAAEIAAIVSAVRQELE
jgi:dTDP-4-amino-4,6-dideoxygalactose transaminase